MAEYFPGSSDDWERRDPAFVAIDPERLRVAIDFSVDPDRAGFPADLSSFIPRHFASLPNDDGRLLGRTKSHGPVTGVVLRHGFLVADWGAPEQVDMTFSVTKSFLSTVAGLAWCDGLIRDVHEGVSESVDDGGFDSPHNARITWDHLLRQTSEWHGTLWDKPSTAGNTEGKILDPVEPGSRYEYNDVRVNRLALCLLRLWRCSLPEILRERVMEPIGASDSWRWHGYDNSWVTIEDRRVQSVSGGGHWGGGIWINAFDLARFGLLTMRNGRWQDHTVIPEEWIDLSRTAGVLNDTYGFMNYFLNTHRQLVPSAPEGSYYHGGAGANRVWVSPEHGLVVVIRWIDDQHFDGFIARLLAAVS